MPSPGGIAREGNESRHLQTEGDRVARVSGCPATTQLEAPMVSVTVFRHIPPPIIGMVGVVQDRAFEAFEEHLDWLEALGVLVERFDPSAAPGEVADRQAVHELLSTEGDRCLPLILVNDALVSRGAYPSRTELARAVGRGRYAVAPGVAHQLAAIGAAAALGPQEELQRQAEQAREMGISEESIHLAGETGAALRDAANMHRSFEHTGAR